MFREDVEVVAFRNSLLTENRVMDSLAELLQIFPAAAFVDVDADQRHVDSLGSLY